ncbi:Arc family DNA-binding protein [Endozoicomonas lisbonensis]|uniref:Arc family DNA-binding protein n=1 Tax=Endozoicomonas lisbonensis TaxID=3120522 RepID=UPI0033967C92
MSREFPVFNLRLPDDLKGRLFRSAKANNRSQNAEYLHRLEKSFEQDEMTKLILEELRALRQEVAELRQSGESDTGSTE